MGRRKGEGNGERGKEDEEKGGWGRGEKERGWKGGKEMGKKG